jgi:hypothetical protein
MFHDVKSLTRHTNFSMSRCLTYIDTAQPSAATKGTSNRYCNHPHAVHSSQQNNGTRSMKFLDKISTNSTFSSLVVQKENCKISQPGSCLALDNYLGNPGETKAGQHRENFRITYFFQKLGTSLLDKLLTRWC